MVLTLLLVFVPVALALDYLHASPILVFLTSALAIIPLAGLMGRSTEDISAYVGPTIGGLLTASLGNAPELIIAIFALHEGLYDVVRASITGSILGNTLFTLGLSMFLGGLRHQRQQFNRASASMNSGLLLLAAIALIVPALFKFASVRHEHELSLEIAIVLFVVYCLSLVFTLKTHRNLFAGQEEAEEALKEGGPRWSKRRAIGMLAAVTVGVAIMSETLVGAIEPAASSLGLTPIFAGVILLALVGNAADLANSIRFARQDMMDLTLGIAVGASLQVALFVAPVLVFVSYALGRPLDLLFTPFEVVAVALAIVIVTRVTSDGESHWMEGAMLVAVYLILAYAFYFLPA